jgi:hypothetical protein
MYIDPQTTTGNNLVKFEENQAKKPGVPMAHVYDRSFFIK